MLADVAAFASQLGLATGGGSEFDDFAPQKAKQSISTKRKKADNDDDAAAPKEKPKRSREDDGSGKQAKPKVKGKGQQQEQQDAKQQKRQGDEAAAINKGREWNFGVGPRPGKLL